MCLIDAAAVIREVGGGDIKIDFQLRNEFGSAFSAQGCSARMAIADWLYRDTNIHSYNGSIVKDENGIYSIASFNIPGTDTVNLRGAYVYQVSIRDILGNLEPPFQGKLIISQSADISFAQGG